jgi:hypothetical protein
MRVMGKDNRTYHVVPKILLPRSLNLVEQSSDVGAEIAQVLGSRPDEVGADGLM